MGPGVPDTYRGCELWALSLVDPDNRRPVDYGLRAEMLATLRRDLADLGGEVLARRLLAEWDDGRIKLFLTWRLLQWRLRHPEAFEANAYRPLETTGRFAECACAFMMGTNVVVVSRLTSRLPEGPGGHPLGEVWGDTGISVEGTRLRNVLTGASVAADQGRLAIAGVLRDLTVAVLEPEDSSRNEEESKQ
jgi:(1->4)-alpha-D-glucan 1-alpha-D-glucosylmutase